MEGVEEKAGMHEGTERGSTGGGWKGGEVGRGSANLHAFCSPYDKRCKRKVAIGGSERG